MNFYTISIYISKISLCISASNSCSFSKKYSFEREGDFQAVFFSTQFRYNISSKTAVYTWEIQIKYPDIDDFSLTCQT